MTKHTPGPWHRNIPPATKYVTIWTGRNRHVADILPSRGISAEEAEANLTLISTAPELLKALKDALAIVEGLLTDSQLDFRQPDGRTARGRVGDYRAVIAKAEGS